MKLTVVDSINFLEACYADIHAAPQAIHMQEIRCRCGDLMRFPLVVRKEDVELFTVVMNSAYEVMDKHGITAHLLNDIKAQCVISIANRAAMEKQEVKT